jgi:hypothetical protein
MGALRRAIIGRGEAIPSTLVIVMAAAALLFLVARAGGFEKGTKPPTLQTG